MAKKIWGVILVLIFCVLLFIFGSVLILFLAPGTEIFGIRYVASGISECSVDQNLESFSGDIYIETYGVPITIEYTDYTALNVSFHQDFVGFTKSKNKVASLDCEIDDDGNLHLTANEIVPWVYSHTMGADYKFVLQIPVSIYRTRSLFIDSTKSSLLLKGNPSCKTFSFTSNESLTIEGSITATNFVYHTDGTITLGSGINCTNVDLYSSSSNINITEALTGDIVAETKGGDIKFVSCKNLTATTNSGSIKNYGEGLNSVSGEVNITTRSGSIELGTVGISSLTNAVSINSRSGSVSISSMYDGEITTDRGKVVVGSARALVVNANVGNVTVDSVSGSIVVNGRNGKVYLGTNGEINNPTVRTTTGAIEVNNAVGEVLLESTSNSISFINGSSTNINLHAGKGLTATNLKGSVTAYANGAVSMVFSQVSNNVDVSVGTKCKTINIDASCLAYDEVDYLLKSTKGTKAKVYAGEELLTESTTIDSSTHAGHYKITVTSSYAEIVLKLGI